MNPPNNYLDLLKHVLSGAIYPESAWQAVRPRSVIKRLLIDFLNRRGFTIMKRLPYREDLRNMGKDWPSLGYTMIGHQRLNHLQSCVETVLADDIPGDFIETGVWRGGAVIMMLAVLRQHGVTDRKVWAADSFEGLPKPDTAKHGDLAGADLSDNDYLKVSLDQVQANLARFGMRADPVMFLKGWFKDTLPTAPVDKLAILRLDGDLYESTMDALESLYDKVSPGGFIIIDDYFSWPSCAAAVNDFRLDRGIKDEIKAVDDSSAYWRKKK